MVIARGQVGFRSHKLHVGQLIRLSFYTDYGVLSVLNHGDYFIYAGMSNIPGEKLQWFEAPSDLEGFYAMGPAGHAVVEIVAAEETEIQFVACSLDDLLPPCARVIAAHSHEPDLDVLLPSTCFLSTDRGAAVRLTGDAGNASVRIDHRVYNWSAPLPSNGLTQQPFYFARVDGDASADLELAFSGQNAQWQFGTVTGELGRGIIGRGAIYEFIPLDGEPYYPDTGDIDASMILLLIVIIMSIVVACCMCTFVCFMGLLSRGRRFSIASSTSPSPFVLYDQPGAEFIDDGQSSSNDHAKEPEAPPADKEPEWDSPYDTL
jgi:hypothetical protein